MNMSNKQIGGKFSSNLWSVNFVKTDSFLKFPFSLTVPVQSRQQTFQKGLTYFQS